MMKSGWTIFGALSVAALHAQVDVGGKADRYHEMLLKKPENPVIFGRYVDAWLESGEMAGMKALLEEKAKAGSAADWRLLAVFRSHSGDETGAIEALDEALKTTPDDPAVRMARAKVLGSALRFDPALADLAIAAKEPTLALEAGTLRGKFLARAGKPAEAVKAWKEVIAANPKDDGLVEDLIELEIGEGMIAEAVATARELVAKTQDPYQKALRGMRVAEILAQGGKKEEALAEYRTVFAVSAEDSWLEREVLARVGGIFGKEEDAVGLKQFYDQLREGYPRRIGLKKEAAKSLMASGSEDEAIGMFREVLKVSPGNRGLREEFISMLETSGHHKEAAEEITALLAKAEEDGLLWERLAEVQKTLQNKAEMNKAVDRAVKLAATDEGGKVAVARIYERFDRKEEAEKILRAALAAHGSGGEAGEAITAFLVKDKPDEAIALWREMAKTADRENLLRISRVVGGSGNPEVAYEILKSRAAEMTNDPLFLAALCQAAQLSDRTNEVAAQSIELVRQAKTAGDLESAVKLAGSILSRAEEPEKWLKELAAKPDATTQELCLLAELTEAEGDSLGSAEILKKAMVRGDGLLAASQRVRLLEMRGDLREAVAAVREWMALPGGMKAAQLKKLVDLLERSGDPEAALVETENWKRIAPGDPQAWMRRVEIFLTEGKPELAVTELRRAIAKFGGDEEMKGRLANAQIEAGMTEEAWRLISSLYDEAESSASKAKWAVVLAGLASREGRIEELTANFQKRSRENPTSVAPLLGLAEMYREWDMPEAELATLNEALRRKPDDVALLNRVADAEEVSGATERAESLFRKAALLQPGRDSERRLVTFRIRNGFEDAGAEAYEAAPIVNGKREGETLASTLFEEKRWEGILDIVARDAAANPSDWRTQYFHAVALYQTGSKAEAFTKFSRLLEAEGEIAGLAPLVDSNYAEWMKDERGVVRDVTLLHAMKLLVAQSKQANSFSFGGRSGTPAPLPSTAQEARIMALAQALDLAREKEGDERVKMLSSLASKRIDEVEFFKSIAFLSKEELQKEMMSDKATALHFRWHFERIKFGGMYGNSVNPDYGLIHRGIEITRDKDPDLEMTLLATLPLEGEHKLDAEGARRLCDGIAKIKGQPNYLLFNALINLSSGRYSAISEEIRKRSDEILLKHVMDDQIKGSAVQWLRYSVPINWIRQGRYDEAVALLNRLDQLPKIVSPVTSIHGAYGAGRNRTDILAFPNSLTTVVNPSLVQQLARPVVKTANNENLTKLVKILGEDEAGMVADAPPKAIDFEAFAKYVPKIANPYLRIGIYHANGSKSDQEMLAREIETLEKMQPADGDALRIAASYYKSIAKDLLKAYVALAKSREIGKSREIDELADGQLVELGTALAAMPPVTVDLEAAKRSALRLRKTMASQPELVMPFADSMKKLGLEEEARRFVERPKSATASRGGRRPNISLLSNQVRQPVDLQAALQKMIADGNKSGAARRLFGDLARAGSNRNDASQKNRLLEAAEELNLNEELLAVAKLDAGASVVRRKLHVDLLLRLKKPDQALPLLRELAAERPDDIEIGSTLFTVLPKDEQQEAMTKLLAREIDEDQLSKWLGRISENDRSVDETLRNLEGFVALFEKIPSSSKPDRNFSWVNHHASVLYRYDGNQEKLRSLWTRGATDPKQEYDEAMSKRRFAMVRRLFEAMLNHPQTSAQGFYLLHAVRENLGLSEADLDSAAKRAIASLARSGFNANSEAYLERRQMMWALWTPGGGYSSHGGPPAKGMEVEQYVAERKDAGVVIDSFSEEFFAELKKTDPDRETLLRKAVEISATPGEQRFKEWLESARSGKNFHGELKWIVNRAAAANREDLLWLAIDEAVKAMEQSPGEGGRSPSYSSTLGDAVEGLPDLAKRVAAIRKITTQRLGPPESWPLFGELKPEEMMLSGVSRRVQLYGQLMGGFRTPRAEMAVLRFLVENNLTKMISQYRSQNFANEMGGGESLASAKSWLDAGLFADGAAPAIIDQANGSSIIDQALKAFLKDEHTLAVTADYLKKVEGPNRFWARLMGAKLSNDVSLAVQELERGTPAILKWTEPQQRDFGLLTISWFPEAQTAIKGPLRKLFGESREKGDSEARRKAENYIKNGFPSQLQMYSSDNELQALIVRLMDDPALAAKLWIKYIDHLDQLMQQSGISFNSGGRSNAPSTYAHDHLMRFVLGGEQPVSKIVGLLAEIDRLKPGLLDFSSGNSQYYFRQAVESDFNRRTAEASSLKQVEKLKPESKPLVGYLILVCKETRKEAHGQLAGWLSAYLYQASFNDSALEEAILWAKTELVKTNVPVADALMFSLRAKRITRSPNLDVALINESLLAYLGQPSISNTTKVETVCRYLQSSAGSKTLSDAGCVKVLARVFADYLRIHNDWTNSEVGSALLRISKADGLDQESALALLESTKANPPQPSQRSLGTPEAILENFNFLISLKSGDSAAIESAVKSSADELRGDLGHAVRLWQANQSQAAVLLIARPTEYHRGSFWMYRNDDKSKQPVPAFSKQMEEALPKWLAAIEDMGQRYRMECILSAARDETGDNAPKKNLGARMADLVKRFAAEAPSSPPARAEILLALGEDLQAIKPLAEEYHKITKGKDYAAVLLSRDTKYNPYGDDASLVLEGLMRRSVWIQIESDGDGSLLLSYIRALVKIRAGNNEYRVSSTLQGLGRAFTAYYLSKMVELPMARRKEELPKALEMAKLLISFQHRDCNTGAASLALGATALCGAGADFDAWLAALTDEEKARYQEMRKYNLRWIFSFYKMDELLRPQYEARRKTLVTAFISDPVTMKREIPHKKNLSEFMNSGLASKEEFLDAIHSLPEDHPRKLEFLAQRAAILGWHNDDKDGALKGLDEVEALAKAKNVEKSLAIVLATRSWYFKDKLKDPAGAVTIAKTINLDLLDEADRKQIETVLAEPKPKK